MEKRISFDQFQSVKRVAQACNPLMVKREKLREKIEKLAAEYKDYDTQIASLEAGIKQVVGFRVEELVKKVIEPGVDVNGQPKKTTKYLPTSIVSYDEQHKQFVINVPEVTVQTMNEAIADGKAEEAVADPKEESHEEAPSEETSDNAQPEANPSKEVPTDAPIFE